jgi:hypothetical protein
MSSSTTRRVLSILTLVAFAVLALGASSAYAGKRDRNRDGIPDRWEKKHRLSLKAKQSNRDPDHDGVRNKCEYQAKTNPRKKDSDRDGKRDGREDADKDGVNNRAESRVRSHCGSEDSDGDGYFDDDELSGEVVSFDDGVLALETWDDELAQFDVAPDVIVKCGWADDEEDLYDDEFAEDEDDYAGTAQYGGDDTEDDPPPEWLGCGVEDLQPGRMVTGAALEDGMLVHINLAPECRKDDE